MSNFIEQLAKEKSDFDNRIIGLSHFLDHPFLFSSAEELELLQEQLDVMRSYREILKKRLDIHTPKLAVRN